jgi:hypothetical protein
MKACLRKDIQGALVLLTAYALLAWLPSTMGFGDDELDLEPRREAGRVHGRRRVRRRLSAPNRVVEARGRHPERRSERSDTHAGRAPDRRRHRRRGLWRIALP